MSRERSLDKETLRRQLKDRKAEIEALTNTLEELETKIRRQERKSQKEINELKSELEEANVDLRNEKKISSKYKNLNRQWANEKEDLKEKIEQLKEELKFRDKKIAECSKWKEQDRVKIEMEQQKKIEDLESENRRLRNSVSSIEQESIKQDEEYKKAESKRREAIEAMRGKIDNHRSEIKLKDKEISELKSHLDESRKVEQVEREKYEQLHCMLKNQQFSIDEYQSKIELLTRELSEVRGRVRTTSLSKETQASTAEEPIIVVSADSSRNLSCVTEVGSDSETCPNCNLSIKASLIEQHLERCLEEY